MWYPDMKLQGKIVKMEILNLGNIILISYITVNLLKKQIFNKKKNIIRLHIIKETHNLNTHPQVGA